MEQFLPAVILAIFGLLFGSFGGASVWRLRAQQLVEDKAAGEKVNAKEYKTLLPLTKKKFSNDRSSCLHCGHVLSWYDLVPLVSWLAVKGKCRYCRQPIGYFEPLIELGVAAFFVVSYLAWPSGMSTIGEMSLFVLWLIAGVLAAILFAYDTKWFLLPNRIMWPLIVVASITAVLHVIFAFSAFEAIINLLFAGFILSGLYLIIWLISKGRWIGFGDVKLGLALALLLGNWQLAFIALFAANVLGCLLVIPGMLVGKITRQTRIPFGPLLILGAVIAMLWGSHIIDWYFTLLI